MAHTDFMRCKSPRVLDRTSQSKLSSIVHCKSVRCLQSCFLNNRFLAAVEVNTKEKTILVISSCPGWMLWWQSHWGNSIGHRCNLHWMAKFVTSFLFPCFSTMVIVAESLPCIVWQGMYGAPWVDELQRRLRRECVNFGRWRGLHWLARTTAIMAFVCHGLALLMLVVMVTMTRIWYVASLRCCHQICQTSAPCQPVSPGMPGPASRCSAERLKPPFWMRCYSTLLIPTDPYWWLMKLNMKMNGLGRLWLRRWFWSFLAPVLHYFFRSLRW